MSQDRTVRFEAGGERYVLCFTQRARKALQEQHGLWRIADIHAALVDPVGLERLLLAGLEGARLAGGPVPGPVGQFTEHDAQRILDQVPFDTVKDLVDRALVLAFLGPTVAKGGAPEETGGGKAVAPAGPAGG